MNKSIFLIILLLGAALFFHGLLSCGNDDDDDDDNDDNDDETPPEGVDEELWEDCREAVSYLEECTGAGETGALEECLEETIYGKCLLYCLTTDYYLEPGEELVDCFS